MKLFWITPECPYPDNTGGRVGIWKRIVNMSRENDIYLYSIDNDKLSYKNKKEMLKFCKNVEVYPKNSKITSLFRAIIYPFPVAVRKNGDLKKKLEMDYKNINPDLIIVDSPQMISVLPHLIWNEKKIVLNEHNMEYKLFASLSKEEKGINKLIYYITSKQMRFYENKIYKKDNILLYTFVSIDEKKFFEEKYKLNKTLLVPVGAKIDIDSEIKENNHIMVFVGKMSYPPNEKAALWLINKVFPIIKRNVKDAQLYLVGKDPQKILYDATKNSEDIIITGTVDSVKEYYDKCNVAVVPIMSGAGVNVKLLEALGNGKLVVSTSKGIEGSEFRDGRHLRVEDTEDGFANACIDLLLNPNSQENIEMKNRASLMMNEKYSWEGIVGEFEKVLKKLVDKKETIH